jgi:ribosome-binding factor A
MSSPKYYNDRVKEQLRHEIASAIANEVRDPRIPPFVTIIELKLGEDTRNATVYVSIYGDKKEEAVKALNKAAPFIQKVVARRLTIKHFPKLYFKLDHSLERGERINELLKQVKDDLA